MEETSVSFLRKLSVSTGSNYYTLCGVLANFYPLQVDGPVRADTVKVSRNPVYSHESDPLA
jgi:hypothetical protein